MQVPMFNCFLITSHLSGISFTSAGSALHVGYSVTDSVVENKPTSYLTIDKSKVTSPHSMISLLTSLTPQFHGSVLRPDLTQNSAF